MRGGFRHLLEKAPDITVVGEACTGREALRLVGDLAPDVLVLDIQMPDLSGVEVAQHLHDTGAPVRVLVLSAHDEDDYITRMLSCGVAGYLTKDEAVESIAGAVRGVAHGETSWFSLGLTAKAVRDKYAPTRSEPEKAARETDGQTPPEPGLLTPLNAREQQVLRLLARGYRNTQIAEQLYLCKGTIKNHVMNIYDKIDVSTRAEAVTWAWRHGYACEVNDGTLPDV